MERNLVYDKRGNILEWGKDRLVNGYGWDNWLFPCVEKNQILTPQNAMWFKDPSEKQNNTNFRQKP